MKMHCKKKRHARLKIFEVVARRAARSRASRRAKASALRNRRRAPPCMVTHARGHVMLRLSALDPSQ